MDCCHLFSNYMNVIHRSNDWKQWNHEKVYIQNTIGEMNDIPIFGKQWRTVKSGSSLARLQNSANLWAIAMVYHQYPTRVITPALPTPSPHITSI
jgi:hypothetical protein